MLRGSIASLIPALAAAAVLTPEVVNAQTSVFNPSSFNSTFAPQLRFRQVNRTCPGCETRPGFVHLALDSELLTNSFLNGVKYTDSGGGAFNVNERVADFWYNAAMRRLHIRSLVMAEVDDPVDIKLARVPGTYPNGPLLVQGGPTVSGHIGFADWNAGGMRAYYAAAQGLTDGNGITGSYLLSLASGQSGNTNLGFKGADELVARVRLFPDGHIDFNNEFFPGTTIPPHVMHALSINGSGGDVPHDVETATSGLVGGTSAWVGCPVGKQAIGGGGGCDNGGLRASQPVNGGWEIVCEASGQNRAYAICAAF
jgi:hypothetical protein